jgi:uncharacterized protein (TIGR02217 family)
METPRFPEDISYGSTGGPMYNTDVITVNSGFETRNANWVQSRHEYNVAFGIRTQAYLDELIEYFHAVQGKAIGFRYKDWADYKSCSVTETVAVTDQTIGTGDSTTGSDGTATYQITKTYTKGSYSVARDITKPVSGTVLVEVNGVTKTESTHYTIDYTTGIITFTGSNRPLTGELVKCGYEFDVPVRFDTDTLSINLEMYEHGTVDVPLVELRI